MDWAAQAEKAATDFQESPLPNAVPARYEPQAAGGSRFYGLKPIPGSNWLASIVAPARSGAPKQSSVTKEESNCSFC